jgi:hypothetical protein
MLQVFRLDVTKVDLMLHIFQLKSRLPRRASSPLRSEKASSSPLAYTSSTAVAAHIGASGLQPAIVEAS